MLRRAGAVEAVALLWPDAQTVTAVVSGAGADDPTDLMAACTEGLPAYMVPRAVRVIEEMPVNANGKVDRAALHRWLDERNV